MLGVTLTSDTRVQMLLAVATVVIAARLAGWLISKLGQPRVSGEILAGIVLGPSVLGLMWPGATGYLFPEDVVGALEILSQLGLVLFMFLIGLELDLSNLRGNGRKAVMISHASIFVPIVLGALLGLWLYPRIGGDVDRLGFTLFLGAAMAITAFPVLARVLQETGLYRTRIGALTVTCAAVDDVTAWCVLAVVVAVVTSTGPGDVVQIVLLSLLFVAVMVKVVKPFLNRLPAVAVWLALALALASSWVTEEIGIHAIFGAFMAGVVMPRRLDVRADVHDRLETITLTLLLPVFFVVVGLATRIDMLDSAYLWGLAGLVTLVAIVGKWGGSALAARVTGESWHDANTIGVLMNTRGLTELVILSVGLELGVINTTVFTIMVVMALVTTLMSTPMLRILARVHRHSIAETAPTVEEVDGVERPNADGAGRVSERMQVAAASSSG